MKLNYSNILYAKKQMLGLLQEAPWSNIFTRMQFSNRKMLNFFEKICFCLPHQITSKKSL